MTASLLVRGRRPATSPVTPGATGCDRSSCPAPSVHCVYVHDQDFYFCHHHWVEVATLLRVSVVAGQGGASTVGPGEHSRDAATAGVEER
jgi:hypothetical protein